MSKYPKKIIGKGLKESLKGKDEITYQDEIVNSLFQTCMAFFLWNFYFFANYGHQNGLVTNTLQKIFFHVPH